MFSKTKNRENIFSNQKLFSIFKNKKKKRKVFLNNIFILFFFMVVLKNNYTKYRNIKNKTLHIKFIFKTYLKILKIS